VVALVVVLVAEEVVEVKVVPQQSYRDRSFYFYFCLFKPKNEASRLETKQVRENTNNTRDGSEKA